jgi:two-component sensor histidine kinase
MSIQSFAGRTSSVVAANSALIQEADHRIKNTIQSVASLLMLQARSCTTVEASVALEDAARRLGVFTRVHELLYSYGTRDRAVDLADVVQTLAEALRATFSNRVSLHVVADHVMVESRLAIPIALLVNEAATNAFKHAYTDEQPGEIFIRVASMAGGLRIGIQDDGVGFSADVREGALGLTLMRTLAAQLDGHLAVLSDQGTNVQLTMFDGVTSHSNGQLAQQASSPQSAP